MTTGAAAKAMGRKYIMIERDSSYCLYGKKRLDSITAELNNIERATFDRKPPKVSLQDMITEGYLKPGETLFYKSKDKKASLKEGGKAVFENVEYSIHELAAIFSDRKATRLNGFDYFQVQRHGKMKYLHEVRTDYREKVMGWVE